ncbi:hypothetical protein F5B19DRAFT_499355 [Rostrohypoxylon terebratum]|nr:hypothetical protein F5B19DRAFT_499355 [Rostrohypoxylon terebratum]
MDLVIRHPEASNSTVSLLDLPTDVVLELCRSFLPVNGPFLTMKDHEDATDGFEALARLARTCKALSYIVIPFLARKRGLKQPFMGVVPYSIKVLRDPEFAHSEGRFTMIPSQTIGRLEAGDVDFMSRCFRNLNPNRTTFGIDVARYIQFHRYQRPTLIASYRTRCEITLLLLSNLPNITSATIDCLIDRQPLQVRASLRLEYLKCVKFIGVKTTIGSLGQHMDGVNLANYDPYFHAARNLKTLEVENMESCSSRLFSLVRLRSISFVNCRMGTADMTRILSSPRLRLRNFVYLTSLYDHYLRKLIPTRGQEMYPNDIIKSLKDGDARDHLSTLVVDLRERGDLSTARQPEDLWYLAQDHNAVFHFMASLKGFPSLRQVNITQQCLWEPYYHLVTGFKKDITPKRPERLIDLLPEAISFFTLSDITMDFFPAIIGLASVVNSKKRFTHLKQVHLYPHPNLIRQITHTKAHLDDFTLHTSNLKNPRIYCTIHPELPAQRDTILELFRNAGVEAEFPLEAYPLSTKDENDLRRQRYLGHWCRNCHFHGDILTVVRSDPTPKEECVAGRGPETSTHSHT